MTEFVVHAVPGSPYGRAVFVTLEEKGAKYRISPVTPGAHKSAPHLTRHPFGRIPVLDHDGFSLYETQAIVRYLDRTLTQPSLSPSDPREAARMDQVMNICDWYLFSGVGNVIGFERVVKPALMGTPADEATVAAAMPKAHTVFQELSRLLGDKSYFAGRQFSLAEIMVAPQIDFLAKTPEWAALIEGRRNIADWLARIVERPSFKATTWERISALAKAA